ncbi:MULTISPECIES: PTS sugar transporter subunit IIB [Enterococcus]|uniref:PTS EIIB type-3 domain-containing protein n=1 Tax=Enterococcus sulfureus ATCC 49903 TaxID=1140003 RepID=S0P1P6_9ENTE|nr:hypothetical protein [Enterococcus sulfureus]EOT48567.1 hypothetical protein OMY_00522 [Enterococcus sulfureus ATCC 49903]EOT87459.1 hypothetical protein I573_00515 [Enterococcus sulfureus ATCC 49903]
MKKVMLICNAGMSTGILAKKIEAASNNSLKVSAYSESEYVDYLSDIDLVLVGPQIRFLMPQIKQAISVPVHAISPVKYGMMDGKAVFEDIQKLIEV